MRKPMKGSEKTKSSGTPKWDTGRLDTIREKFTNANLKMQETLVERDSEISMVLTALLCKEHPLLVGPPGTAKSMLIDTLMDWFEADRDKKFTILFNKFSVPEEVFGPISVNGLKADVYQRITKGKLPEAFFGFGDEIFKANSAILNTLLRLLNEGVFDNGEGWKPVPLLMFLGASNEFPDAESGGRELSALFDRFLFRRVVHPIRTKAGRARLYWTNRFKVKFDEIINVDEVKYAQKFVPSIPWEEDAQEAFVAVIEELNNKGIFPGDRRLRKSVNACRGYAFLCGDEEVSVDHIEICKETLWDDHNNQPPLVYDVIVAKANPSGMAVSSMLVKAEDIINKKTPADAVPALQELQKDLKKLKEEPRKAAAMAYLSEQIEHLYMKITGKSK